MSRVDQSIGSHAFSPSECGKMLNEMKELKAQLLFLISMNPSQQISTLANAEEKTRDSILSNIPQPSRREISRHIAAFQTTKYQPWSTIPEELTSMILENLIPRPSEEWTNDDIATVSSILLVCRRSYRITIPFLKDLYIHLDAGPHSLSARMASGPTNAELSEPPFCNCFREYCGCVKKDGISPLWANIKGSQTPTTLTLHMKYGRHDRSGSRNEVRLPHFNVYKSAAALLEQHKINQLEIEVIVWTTMEQAKYSFNWYTTGLSECYEVFKGKTVKIVRILFKGPDIQFGYTIPCSGKMLGNNIGGPWSFMDFQKFVDWQHTVSDAFLDPGRNYAVLQGLEYPFLDKLKALSDITEVEDVNLRVQIGYARKLELI